MKANKITIALAVLVVASFWRTANAQKKYPYQRKELSVSERVEDLMSRMTVEEKVGQLLCPMGWSMYSKDEKGVSYSEDYMKQVLERGTGMFWATFRADSWTKKTLENGLNPEQAAEAANALQRYAVGHSRLGIPVFLAEEAPHGHMAIGTTVFPTGIGQASTFNPELIREMGRIIGKEVRLQGGHIAYGPVLDLARDPRWSRVEETYGEDPVLTAVMGAALVDGMGGGNLGKPYSVISTLKHFVAYGVPEGGQNGSPSVIGRRDLFENVLLPFQAAIDAGALSVMTAYNSMDGIPCTMNAEMLRDVLLDQWGFRGFTVSDLFSIEGICNSHRVARTLDEAARYALKAGVNVDLGGEAFATLVESVKQGKVDIALVDEAVEKVLRLKFEMGLFDNPYVDPQAARTGVRTAGHIAVAREMARQSVVLLENKNGLLPLDRTCRVAVIGPNADSQYNMLGDYTAPQPEEQVVTVLEAVKEYVGADNVSYVKGCAIRDTAATQINEAVEAARLSDVVVLVVGGSSARDFKTSYKETGAAVVSDHSVSDMECGEGYDRMSLKLLGKQQELLEAVEAAGKPVIVIYIQGRPLDMKWAKEHADALLTAWYPGQEGGHGIADVLFGAYNPSGRLPVSIPESVGQLPVYYNRKNPQGHDYVEMSARPLYAFGYGLSYTSFEYSDLKVDGLSDGKCRLSFVLTNCGDYDGTEVVQIYLRDEYASVVRPRRQLAAFGHVSLRKGESRRVEMEIDEARFSLVDASMNRVVESGDFTLMIGASSDDIRLKQTIRVP